MAEPCRDGGFFAFENFGWYMGEWKQTQAHGHGICLHPTGEYAGAYHEGDEKLGVFCTSKDTPYERAYTYAGEWHASKRQGLGCDEDNKLKARYQGEWKNGCHDGYGVRKHFDSVGRYEGEWYLGLKQGCPVVSSKKKKKKQRSSVKEVKQRGYGCEVYHDGGTYIGQFLGGARDGVGVRNTAHYIDECRYKECQSKLQQSLTSVRSEADFDNNNGVNKINAKKWGNSKVAADTTAFVLFGRVESSLRQIMRPESHRTTSLTRLLFKRFSPKPNERQSCRSLDRRAACSGFGLSPCSTVSRNSRITYATGSENSYHGNQRLSIDRSGVVLTADGDYDAFDELEPETREWFTGQWKHDVRTGYGVCCRQNGLKYEGEWRANKKNGYGRTTFPNGEYEEGLYRDNVLVKTYTTTQFFSFSEGRLRYRTGRAIRKAQIVERETARDVQKAALASRKRALAAADDAARIGAEANNEKEKAYKAAWAKAPSEMATYMGQGNPGEGVLNNDNYQSEKGDETYIQMNHLREVSVNEQKSKFNDVFAIAEIDDARFDDQFEHYDLRMVRGVCQHLSPISTHTNSERIIRSINNTPGNISKAQSRVTTPEPSARQLNRKRNTLPCIAGQVSNYTLNNSKNITWSIIITEGVHKHLPIAQASRSCESLHQMPVGTIRFQFDELCNVQPCNKNVGSGSLPDVNMCREIQQSSGHGLDRTEATILGQARRQQVQQEARLRHQGEIIYRLLRTKQLMEENASAVVFGAVNIMLLLLFTFLLNI